MRDLQKVVQECLREVEALGIPYGLITKVEVNTRAKSRWGQCRHYRHNAYHTININVDLLDERNDINGLKNVIIHEILHTCPGCQNHGTQWKAYAGKVNKAYGYGVKCGNSASELGVKTENQYRYAVRCKECGTVTKSIGMKKYIRYPQNYHCAFCKGSLERIA